VPESTHRMVTRAIEAGNLSEVVRLCWRDVASGKFCSDQVQCLAAILQYFNDPEGLVLLREKVDERILRDGHYRPPLRDGRDDLIQRLAAGIEWGQFVQGVEAYVRQCPAITRRQMYERYNVYENREAKRQADRTKPKELRSEEGFNTQYFESRLCLFIGVERTRPDRFRVIRSAGTGLDESLSLHTFEKVNLRPSPAPASPSHSKVSSRAPLRRTEPKDSPPKSVPKQGCVVATLLIAALAVFTAIVFR
jgi:hypothetical protein